MSVATYIFYQDEEGSIPLVWKNSDNELRDFSSGYTFEVKLAVDNTTAPILTKTTGITGAATSPNITITFAAGELNKTPGTYPLYLKATDGSSNDSRYAKGVEPKVVILATPASAP